MVLNTLLVTFQNCVASPWTLNLKTLNFLKKFSILFLILKKPCSVLATIGGLIIALCLIPLSYTRIEFWTTTDGYLYTLTYFQLHCFLYSLQPPLRSTISSPITKHYHGAISR